jgi:hypothetical protein
VIPSAGESQVIRLRTITNSQFSLSSCMVRQVASLLINNEARNTAAAAANLGWANTRETSVFGLPE